MNVLRKVAIALVALVVLFVAVGLVLPRQWHVERAVVIYAPSERIHPFLANPRRWQDWGPWTKAMDPLVKYTYTGAEEGVGAQWAWLGPKMGRGRMKVTFSDPKQGVKLEEAIESDEINAHASLTYKDESQLALSKHPAQTRVVWRDEGTLPPVMGGYFLGMVERMLGENFEVGLAKLKAAVEALPPLAPPPPAAVPDSQPVEAVAAPDAG